MMQDRFDSCLGGLLPGDGGAVLLAVSGGIDSMVMADLFLGSCHHCSLCVAHCNFHLRGDESDADEAFVRKWAEDNGIPFRKVDFDTCEYAASNGISVEMAARDLRYSWFASLCLEGGSDAVTVAHNANDNAETLILNLLRGTGLRGLCGMRPSGNVPGHEDVRLIRPLLGFSREEIYEYALSRGLAWREDSTNADSAYKRNLIRNEIFPLFRKINPSFLDTLTGDMGRFAEVQAIADDYFARSVSEVRECGEDTSSASLRFAPCTGKPTPNREKWSLLQFRGVKEETEGKWSVDEVSSPAGETFFEGEVSIGVERLKGMGHWKYLLYRLLEPYGFNQSVMADLCRLIEDGAATFSGRRFYSQDYVAETSRGVITISAMPFDFAQCPQKDTAILVEEEGEYSLGGVNFVVEKVEVEDPKTKDGTTVAAIDFPFTVRPWQEGDWMRPLGMKGRRKKLSDMFTDLKFSRAQKERALVIADEGSHVLALIGYRIDESVKVGREAVRIRLI